MDYGVAVAVLPGEKESGDHAIVCPQGEGVMVAAVDGVGHGEEAAAAARAAIGVIRQNPEEHVLSLVRLCHLALRPTRGATMGLASFDGPQGVMTWIGVGNVEGILLHNDGQPVRQVMLQRGGVVGGQLPPLQAAVLPVQPGDILVFATDGIKNEFAQAINIWDPPQTMAERILARCAKGNDDALVLVVRYLGWKP